MNIVILELDKLNNQDMLKLKRFVDYGKCLVHRPIFIIDKRKRREALGSSVLKAMSSSLSIVFEDDGKICMTTISQRSK